MQSSPRSLVQGIMEPMPDLLTRTGISNISECIETTAKNRGPTANPDGRAEASRRIKPAPRIKFTSTPQNQKHESQLRYARCKAHANAVGMGLESHVRLLLRSLACLPLSQGVSALYDVALMPRLRISGARAGKACDGLYAAAPCDGEPVA